MPPRARRSRFGRQPPQIPPDRPVIGILPRPPRKSWEQLSPGTRRRYLSYFQRQYGYDEQTVALEYNRGTLGPLSAARGHAQTPERPISYEQATPEQRQRYSGYFGGDKGPIKVAVARRDPVNPAIVIGVVLLISGLTRRERQTVYRHWLAVFHYADTGDTGNWSTYGRGSVAKILSAGTVTEVVQAGRPRRYRNRGLAAYQGVTVGTPDSIGTEYNTGNPAGVGPFELLTDLNQIDNLYPTHELDFEGLYPFAENPGSIAA
jgi:hypothetical protein